MQQSDRPDSPQAPPRTLTTEEKAELRTGTVIKNWINTDGWKIYRTILEAHLNSKRLELEAPAEVHLDGLAQALRFESAKGAIMGLRLALSIPDGIINNDKMLRHSLGILAAGEEDD
jgi:hypothetical protein